VIEGSADKCWSLALWTNYNDSSKWESIPFEPINKPASTVGTLKFYAIITDIGLMKFLAHTWGCPRLELEVSMVQY
jgi:hypothetical protein